MACKYIIGNIEYKSLEDIFVALNPSQIKSATENVGTFDNTNPDIRFKIGEEKTAEEINQELIDRLKQNGLSEDVFLMSTEEIDAKLKELGVSDDVRKQVIAYHGSPYSFDRFTTNAMGTGEGAQAFGWGLYFTDLQSIARNYASTLAGSRSDEYYWGLAELAKPTIDFLRKKFNEELLYLSEEGYIEKKEVEEYKNRFDLAKEDFDKIKELYRELELDSESPFDLSSELNDDIFYFKNNLNSVEDIVNKVKSLDYLGNKEQVIQYIKENEKSRNLYKVSLHKGKTPSEYIWLEWDREVPKNLVSNIRELEKELFDIIGTNLDSSGNKIDIIEGTYGKSGEGVYDRFEPEDDDGNFIDWLGQNVYQNLDNILFDSKQASLLLLKYGIDGIKYPAESISRGATSDNARGFNYVIFDENAITIEEQIQFQKALNKVGIDMIVNGFVYKNQVFLNKDVASNETAIHEFSHLFNSWLKENRKELYNKGIDLVKAELEKTAKVSFSKQSIDNENKDFIQDFSTATVKGKEYQFLKAGNVFYVEVDGVGEVAKATLNKDGYLDNIRVDENYRRKGIGSSLYDYIENISGNTLKPSPIKISKEAQSLWEKRERKSEIQDIIDFVKTNQPNLKGEALEEEILTELTGRRGSELLSSKKKSGIIDWIREAFKEIGKMLGLLEATPEQVSKMTLKEFADASAVQMLKGENIGQTQGEQIRFQIIGEQGASRIQEYQDLLNQAKELEAKGEDYSQTGWYKGVDGWKYLSKEVIENFKIVNKEENKVLKLKEVLGNENILFKIYPEMQELSVVFLNKGAKNYEKFDPIDQYTAGEFQADNKIVRINTHYQGNIATLEQMQNTLGHEVSHYGQRLEGFSRGGNQQTILQEALDILGIEGDGKYLGALQKEIREADKSNLTQNQSKIVEDSLKTINALMTRNINVLMYQYKRLMGEIDANIVGELSSNGVVKGTYADLLSMYLNRENIDPQSIYYVSGNQIQFSLIEPYTTKVTEPRLSFETPSGEATDNYQEALQKTDQGNIKLNIEDVNVGEVSSDTDVRTFEGTINHLVKSGGLTGRRYIDKNGEVVFETLGKSETAKQLTANLVEEQVAKLLGQRNIKRLKNGDFILKDGLNKITINGEEFNKKDIDNLDFTQLTQKFGRETALRIELMREYSKALQPTKTKKRLEEVDELKTEDELVSSIKSLLNRLGIKIASIEDYIKNNKLKNNDVNPSANALMDVVNKIMAFKNGVITREDLIEETMHLIEATFDPKLTEGVRKNIHKTEEWKQYSEHYFNIYSKEYSGDKLEEMVRREILGKVMANAVMNNFTLEQNASLTKQSIFEKIRELLQQFFDKINAYFKPEYQRQIDQLNNDIYAKLMSGTLYNEMNLDQNFGTKFRLYSTSTNMSDSIVLLQKQAEKALDVLASDKKTQSNKSTLISAVRDILGDSAEKLKNNDQVQAKLELIQSFSQIINMTQRQVNYLQTAAKKAEANKHPFSAEEMAVYMNLVNQFDANILPTVVETIKGQNVITNADKKILEKIEKLQGNINSLKGKVGTSGFNAKDYTVRLLVERLGLDAETEKFLQEQVNSTQTETNWFFIQFGNLSHSSNIFLNALGHVITKTDFDKRQGFMEDIKPFIERLANLDFLKGGKLSEFIKGNYLQSAYDFEKIEQDTLNKKYTIYQEVIKERLSDNNLPREDRDNLQKKLDNLPSIEDFSKIEVFDDLDIKTSQDIERRLNIWKAESYNLSPFYSDEYATRREKLAKYSPKTQAYLTERSAEYSSIYDMAEEVNGRKVVTADMKYRFEQLKKEEVQAKDVFDMEGNLKKGLYLSDQTDPNAIEISRDFFVGIDRNVADDLVVVSFELNQIAQERLKEAKEKNSGNDFSKDFEDMLRSLDSEAAYEFLTLNAYITYSQEYYDSFKDSRLTEIENLSDFNLSDNLSGLLSEEEKRGVKTLDELKKLLKSKVGNSIIDKLESAKDGENDSDIDVIIEDIKINSKKINTILQANKHMNNPSEVNFDGMESSEISAVKEYQESLELAYQKARKYLPKSEEDIEPTVETETKPNKAFFDYIFDSNPDYYDSGIVPDFSEIDFLSEDDYKKINKVFAHVINHTTQNKKRELLDLKRDVERFARGSQTKFNKLHQRIFSITEDDLKSMSEAEIMSALTKDLIKYSYTKLMPYFKKTQPTNVDLILRDLEAGKITPSEFIEKCKSDEYKYLQISPNFNFQDATKNNNIDPQFEIAKSQGNPMYRIFEKGTTESDLVGKSVEQLIKEGKINKYVDKTYFEEYGIDLVKLFNGEEVATKNIQKFEARKALIDLQRVSLEKNGILGRHNLYQLPQKEKSKTRKLEDFFSRGVSLKSLWDEIKNFREDDLETGQDNKTDKYGRTIATIDNLKIPTFGVRKLKDSPVTDDLLESYVWMNYKANEHKARKDNYQDAFNIGIAAFGDDFGYKTSSEAGNNYKMFKEAMDYNFYGIKETWSYKVQTGIFGEVDIARLLQNFGKWIRIRNLGFTLISPITSATTGSVFKLQERLIGENIDKDAEKVANSFFRKHAKDASLEMLSLESKTILNSLGELYGWYEPLERYENTKYSKALRGLGKAPMAAHQLANFPINTRVGLSVLANHRFFEGKLLEFRDFNKLFPGKSEKEVREIWKQQVSVLDSVKLEKDGRITYDYNKIATALNNGFTEQEAKEFIETKNSSIIRGRIKAAIQKIDGAISEEDRSMSTRNAFFSFVNIHRAWLFIAIQNRFKSRQLNLQTGRFEEGSFRSTYGYFRDFLKSIKVKGLMKALSEIKKDFDSYDEVTKRNVKRTLYELAVLQAFVAFTALAMKELDDDDEDGYLFKASTLFLMRTTNELASSSVALHKNLAEMRDNVIVGTNAVEILTQSSDFFSSDLVTRGRFAGMTERERYIFRQVPIMREYNNLFSDVDGTIKSYNYFNFVKGGNLDYSIYPFFQEDK